MDAKWVVFSGAFNDKILPVRLSSASGTEEISRCDNTGLEDMHWYSFLTLLRIGLLGTFFTLRGHREYEICLSWYIMSALT